MDRRRFVTRLAALASGAAGLHATAARAESASAAFARQLALHPDMLGVASVSADLPPQRATLEGRLPAGLRGTLFRNGPGRHERGDARYRHWFDGDGLVHAWSIDAAGVAHRARFVATPKLQSEESAGRFLWPAFGTRAPDQRPVGAPDDINVANTSLLRVGDELLALWEGGSAWRLDPATLDSRGPKQWNEDLAGAPFSAHPKVDPDGSIWNFGVLSGRNGLVVYRIDRGGKLLDWKLLPLPYAPMMHDFAVTDRHLVFPMPPLVYDGARTRAGASFLDSHVWRPELGMRVLVVDKADLARTRWHELPAGFLFHLGNAWEDDQGTIRFDCALAPDDSTLRAFGSLMSGDYRPGTDSVASLVTLPRQGPGRIERTGLQTEFPRIDARRVGLRHRTVYSVMRSPARTGFGFDRVIALDLEGGRLDSYDYGPDMLVEEHLFVPDPARRGERGGWLLGTALDVRARATRLSIFDAGSLASGPVAQATLGRPLPLGFHGVFTAA